MANSFRVVDYRLRPAKVVERRMMGEAFLRLRHFAAVERYAYVGMGSVYFADFALFHAMCGFETMVSIEDTIDATQQDRFRFNAPFGSIQLEFGHTNSVLPRLKWKEPVVAWLDYTGQVDDTVIRDLRFLATNVVSGSLIAVSVNTSHRDGGEPVTRKTLADRLKGIQALPDWVLKADRFGPSIVPVYRDILTQTILAAINARNAGQPADKYFVAEPVFFFTYSDNAPMMTLGWVVFAEEERATFRACKFHELKFAPPSPDEPFKIECPFITHAEMRAINKQHSKPGIPKSKPLPIPPSEVEKYEKIRRYWPVISIPELT